MTASHRLVQSAQEALDMARSTVDPRDPRDQIADADPVALIGWSIRQVRALREQLQRTETALEALGSYGSCATIIIGADKTVVTISNTSPPDTSGDRT